jgi:hypothetical protein
LLDRGVMMEIFRVPVGSFHTTFVRNGPLDGDVPVNGFYGPRAPIVTPAGTTGMFHYGIDMPAPLRTPIRPRFAAMKVTENGWDNMLGWYVRTEAVFSPIGNLRCDYFHLDERSKFVINSVVQPSEILGLVGKTGAATGVHLHWQVRDPKTGLTIDPLSPPTIALLNGAIPMTNESQDWYTVRPGDTFAGIAAAFGVADWRDIRRWSGLPDSFPPTRLAVGTRLRVTDPHAQEPDSPPDGTEAVRPLPSPEAETAYAALVRALHNVDEVAADLREKAGILSAASDAAEAAAVRIQEIVEGN